MKNVYARDFKDISDKNLAKLLEDKKNSTYDEPHDEVSDDYGYHIEELCEICKIENELKFRNLRKIEFEDSLKQGGAPVTYNRGSIERSTALEVSVGDYSRYDFNPRPGIVIPFPQTYAEVKKVEIFDEKVMITWCKTNTNETFESEYRVNEFLDILRIYKKD